MKKRRFVSRALAVVMALTMLGCNFSVVHAENPSGVSEEQNFSSTYLYENMSEEDTNKSNNEEEKEIFDETESNEVSEFDNNTINGYTSTSELSADSIEIVSSNERKKIEIEVRDNDSREVLYSGGSDSLEDAETITTNFFNNFSQGLLDENIKGISFVWKLHTDIILMEEDDFFESEAASHLSIQPWNNWEKEHIDSINSYTSRIWYDYSNIYVKAENAVVFRAFVSDQTMFITPEGDYNPKGGDFILESNSKITFTRGSNFGNIIDENGNALIRFTNEDCSNVTASYLASKIGDLDNKVGTIEVVNSSIGYFFNRKQDGLMLGVKNVHICHQSSIGSSYSRSELSSIKKDLYIEELIIDSGCELVLKSPLDSGEETKENIYVEKLIMNKDASNSLDGAMLFLGNRKYDSSDFDDSAYYIVNVENAELYTGSKIEILRGIIRIENTLDIKKSETSSSIEVEFHEVRGGLYLPKQEDIHLDEYDKDNHRTTYIQYKYIGKTWCAPPVGATLLYIEDVESDNFVNELVVMNNPFNYISEPLELSDSEIIDNKTYKRVGIGVGAEYYYAVLNEDGVYPNWTDEKTGLVTFRTYRDFSKALSELNNRNFGDNENVKVYIPITGDCNVDEFVLPDNSHISEIEFIGKKDLESDATKIVVNSNNTIVLNRNIVLNNTIISTNGDTSFDIGTYTLSLIDYSGIIEKVTGTGNVRAISTNGIVKELVIYDYDAGDLYLDKVSFSTDKELILNGKAFLVEGSKIVISGNSIIKGGIKLLPDKDQEKTDFPVIEIRGDYLLDIIGGVSTDENKDEKGKYNVCLEITKKQYNSNTKEWDLDNFDRKKAIARVFYELECDPLDIDLIKIRYVNGFLSAGLQSLPSDEYYESKYEVLITGISDEGKISQIVSSRSDIVGLMIDENYCEELVNSSDMGKVYMGDDIDIIFTLDDASNIIMPNDYDLLKSEEGMGHNDLYLKLTLQKKIGENEVQTITETSEKIRVGIGLPDSLINTNSDIKRTYKILSLYNGVVTPIDATLEDKTLYFETDKFSIIAINVIDEYADTNPFKLYAIGVDDSEQFVASFNEWKDCSNYIFSLGNANTKYCVRIIDDVTIATGLTLPANNAGIKFVGVRDNDRITVQTTGNIKLSSDTEFENIDFKFINIDKQGNITTNTKATIDLNGKKLSFKNVLIDENNAVASIKGSGSSYYYAEDDSEVHTSGDFSVPNCTLKNSSIIAKNINIANDLYMTSSEMNSLTNVTLKNLHSLDDNNSIVYANGKSNSTFKINGIVDAIDEDGVNHGYDYEIVFGLVGTNAWINFCAVNVCNGYYEDIYADYTDGLVLLTGKMAPESMFAVSRNGNTARFITAKQGEKIVVSTAADSNVLLYNVNADSSEVLLGNFANVNDAFSEITRLNNKNATYKILLNESTEAEDVNFPSALKKLTVEGKDNTIVWKYDKKISIKSDVTFNGVHVKSGAAAGGAIDVGAYNLTFVNSKMKLDSNITGVTGKGILALDGSILLVKGSINVGKIVEVGQSGAKIAAVAKITKDKNGNITNIEPGIVLTDGIVAEDSLAVGMLYVDDNKNVVPFLQSTKGLEYLDNNGIKMVKTAKGVTENVVFLWDGDDLVQNDGIYHNNNNGTSIIKQSNYLVYVNRDIDEIPYTLFYDGNFVKFLKFSDAVAEINTLKNKNTSYTILLSGGSGDEANTKATAETLVMPAANNYKDLTIASDNLGDSVTLYYKSDKITFTGDTTLRDVVLASAVDYAVGKEKPLNIAISANKKLTIEGCVEIEERAVIIDGAKKGSLKLDDAEFVAGISVMNTGNVAVQGAIKNILDLEISEGTELDVLPYLVNGKRTEPELSVTNMTLVNNHIEVGDDISKTAKMSADTLSVSDGSVVRVKGSLTTKTVNANEGLTNKYSLIFADTDTKVTGDINLYSDKLIIRARQTTKALPYLTISGNIVKKVDGAKLYVDLYENANPASVRPDANTFEIKLMTAAKADTTLIGTASDYDENSGAATIESYSVGANPDGCIPVKNGNYISLYDANSIGCEAIADGASIGYYTDLPKALAAIEARKDKKAEYEVVLYKDAGSSSSVLTLNLPANAKKLTINGYNNHSFAIWYMNGITLKSDTVLGYVTLNPVTNKGVPIASPIRAGNFNLSFDNTYVNGDPDNPRISEITANKNTTIDINTVNPLCVNKVDTKGSLKLHREMIANGVANITTLYISDGRTLTLNKPVKSTITDIYNKSGSNGTAGTIMFTRINDGLKNESSSLTINGHIYNDSATDALNLKMNTKIGNENYFVKDGTEFNTAKALFNAKFVETDEVNIYIIEESNNGNSINLNADMDEITPSDVTSGSKGLVAKSSGNFYYMCGSILGNSVALHNDNDTIRPPKQYYADFNQAVSRIVLDGNAQSAYTIYVGLNDMALTDTNLTDKVAHSSMTLPAQNKIGKLTIETGVVDASNNPKNVELMYSGNIAAYGSPEITVAGCSERGGLFFNGITLHNVNVANDKEGYTVTAKTGTVSVLRNSSYKTGCVDFALNNSSFTDTVNAINGTKSATNVVVGKDITLNQGFNNIAKLTIKPNATVTTNGKSAVDEVYFVNNTSRYNAKGVTTVGNIRIDLFNSTTPTGPSMLVSIVKNKPQFTLTGSVTDSAGGSLNANSKLNLLVMDSGVTDIIGEAQLDIPFIKAAKADASSFMLKQNVVLANGGTLIAYKDKDSNVMFGNLNDMAIRVKRDQVPEKGYTAIDTYAKSWDDALAIVKSTAQESEYTFELLKDIRLDEAKKRITFPEAKMYTKLNVVGFNDENRKLFFTGDLSTTDAIYFEHITLPYGISVTNGGAYDLAFGDGTCTAIKEGETYVDSGLAFNKITVSNKAGSITINKKSDNSTRQFVINADTTVNGALITEGKVEIIPGAGKKFTVGDIVGIGGDDADYISIEAYRSADKNSSPLMSINGNVKDVEEIHIRQRMYDVTAKSYYPCTAEGVLAMAYNDANKAPTNAQKIINLPVSSGYGYKMDVYDAANNRWVEFDETTNNLHFAKTQKVLVLTSLEDAVEVQGDEYLSTTFLSWSDAIAEINNRSDKNENYKITILKDLGRDKDGNITTASMLKKFETPGANKASVVEIYGGYHDIYTNSVANITFNTDTVIWNDFRYFNLKVNKNVYTSNDINVTVGNGYELDWIYLDDRFLTDVNDTDLLPANVRSFKGSAKSKLFTSYEGMVNIDDSVTGFGEWTIAEKTRVNVAKNVSVADLIVSDKAKLNYKGSVTVSNKLEVYGGGIYAAENCTGNLTAKNTSLVDAEVYAINMTLNGETKLKNSLLSTAAGAKAGQGRMTLADVTLLSDENNIIVKQDAKGISMLTINGNVTRQDDNATLIVALLYNKALARLKPIQSDYVVLHNGTMIAVAPKCDADMISINPKNYSVISNVLGLYKSGKNINYGTR